ncbi:hypothetical protein DRN76_00985 [Methanosarcinales archaeon]|nr:MAG: hypothetical protein DRN76_00985 [Methanosarcinales archaeon]
MVWMNKQSVYAVKAKRIVIVLLLLSVFAIAFTIVEYPSQGEISTQPLIDAGVSPLKVRPGDAMLITASCVDPAGIETVTADMGGIETIQLSLISGTICDGTWQATWLVHDTEVRDYNTTVTATNVFGESSSVNIGWSDPATSGMGAYGESGATAPRYRLGNVATGLGDEQSANNVGGETNIVVLRSSRTRNEKILGVLDKSGDINVQVWNGTAWGTVLEVTTIVADVDYRGFDIAYEDSSGDAIIVYQNNVDDPLYRVWNGTGWSDAATLDLPTADIPVWIVMASKPGSDEIIVETLDKGLDVTAAVWDGSAWGNSINLEGDAILYTYRAIAIDYESTSGDAMVAWSDKNEKTGGPQYRFWNGSAWGAEATAPETGDEPRFIELGSDPSSDKIVMSVMDSFNDVNVNVWNGSAWGNNIEAADAAEQSNKNPCDVEFESTSGEAIVVYGLKNNEVLRYRTWNATDWSDELQGPDFSGDIQTCDVRSDPNSDVIMLAVVTDNPFMEVAKWNGSAWGPVNTLEDNPSSIYAVLMFAPDRHFIISDVNASGYYSVGDTISVTWNLTGSASATENYTNVEYWDVTEGAQFDLKSYDDTSVISSTSKALTDSEVGHKIAVYVYTTSSDTGDNSTAITRGDPWPYSIVDAVTTWESYNCTERTSACQDDTFSGDEDTVYMHGTGFTALYGYKIAYYEADTDGGDADTSDKIETDTVDSDVDGNLSSNYDFTSNSTADPGTWHAIVCNSSKTPPTIYNSSWSDIIADDSFTVEESAIPEFPAVIAAIAVCMLCAISYIFMRRKAIDSKQER